MRIRKERGERENKRKSWQEALARCQGLAKPPILPQRSELREEEANSFPF
jgi:hypothetical protein